MLHGDAGALLSFTNELASIRTCIDEIVNFFCGSGTIIVPTFTYSATKSQTFIPELSPSAVGIFSEMFRNHEAMRRTMHPNFSVSVSGKKCREILNTRIDDAFGEGTVFDFLYRDDAELVTLGCSLDSLTFTHYVEQQLNVTYRYMKSFHATIENQNEIRSLETTYFVRNLESDFDTTASLSKFRKVAIEEKKLRVAKLGRYECTAIKARECFELMKRLLSQDELSLVRGGKKSNFIM